MNSHMALAKVILSPSLIIYDKNPNLNPTDNPLLIQMSRGLFHAA